MASCDYTICSKDSVFSIKETAIGRVANLGLFQRIIKNGGNVGILKKYSYSGENFGWNDALKLGIVGEVAGNSKDLEEKTFSLAEKLGSMSPLVSRGIKKIIHFSRDNSINTSLEMIATMNEALLQSKDVESSVRAVLTKSKAIYPKL